MNQKAPVASGNFKKVKKRSPFKRITLATLKYFFLFLLLICFAAGGVGAGIMVAWVKTATPVKPQMLTMTQNSIVYDGEGNEVMQLTARQNREYVSDSDIPQNLKDAYVALEDQRFYDHIGIDIRRITSAVIKLGKHGGSTITQQLVRNLTMETQRTLKRKVQEWWLAIQLETKMDKWQILESYMNVIYMGPDCYGVQAASKKYYNKNVWDLSLAECASLAGITNNPDIFGPFSEKRKENNIKRQHIALQEMLKQGYITQDEYDQALNEPIVFYDGEKDVKEETSTRSYFVDQVISDVRKDLIAKGYSEQFANNLIFNSGVKIYTTLDQKLQNAMDEVFTDEKYFPVTSKYPEAPQASMVLIDPYTGQVKALYGGHGKKNGDAVLNRATQINRPPGSSIKPIAVYGPALNEKRITAGTIIDDVPLYMDNMNPDKRYPENYDKLYQGLTPIRDAIRNSLNTVAAQVYRDYLGPDMSLQYLKKVGIDRNQKNISLSLGGLEKGVNPLQMAAAYVPFINKGMYLEPTTYTQVVTQDGLVILDKKSLKPSIVYDEEAAFIMSDMLSGVVTFGTAYPYGTVKNEKGEIIQTAGKTGTTSDNRDKWFVGFSSYYVGATWYGYDKNYEIPDGVERSQALNLWQQVMLRVHKDLKPKDFEKPSGIVEKNICISSGKVNTDLCFLDPRNPPNVPNSIRYGEYFIKGTEPKDNDKCDVHVKAKVCTEDTPDGFGRYPLATDKCPDSTTKEMVFVKRIKPFVPINPEDPFPLDWSVELPTEKCAIHKTPLSSVKPTATPKGSQNPKTSPSPTPTATPKNGR